MASELIGLRIAIQGVAEARRNIGVVQGDIGNLEKQIRSLSGTSQTIGRSLVSVGDTLSRIGRDLTITLSAPLAAISGLLVRSGIQFEDTFAGIAKTVEGVAEVGANGLLQVTEAGSVLRNEIRQLAQEIPVSANELNNIGQIAGQLGVRGTDNLLTFIETVAKMGVATNLSSQEAAFGIARMFNILDPVGREVQNVGEFTTRTAATLVDLGNNASATESEILDMALRLSGAGRVAGLSTPQILGFSASLAEIGVRAELGGTAVSRVLQEMVFAIADGGDELESFAKLAGKTAADFAADFKGDPTTAMIEFIKKLAEAQEQGLPGLKDILDDVGLGGVRVRDVLNRLGGDTGVLTKNVNRANEAWEKQMALQVEAEKRFSTIQSKIGILKNRFVDLGITIFDLVKEDLNRFLTAIGDLIDMFKTLDPNTQKLIITLTGIAIAIGPILAVVGILISLLGAVVTGIGALLSPVALLVAGVAAAVLGLGFLVAQFIDVQDVVQGVIDFIKKLIDTISGLLTGKISVKDIFPPDIKV
jgi:TP901 family phage tail tape measure protein